MMEKQKISIPAESVLSYYCVTHECEDCIFRRRLTAHKEKICLMASFLYFKDVCKQLEEVLDDKTS